MASIASLAVQLTANTAPFNKGMKAATGPVKAFSASVSSSNSILDSFMGRVGGMVSVGATLSAAMMKLDRSFDTVENIGDMSAALGASVKDFNALRMATAGAGNDIEKTTAAIARMTKALGDDSGAKAFRQLGLDPAQLRQMDSVKAFESVAKQINKLPTAFDRAKAMSDLFGKSWIDMAEIVGNVDAIERSRLKLDKMGLTITEVDTAMVDAANTASREFFATLDAGFDKSASNMAKFKKNFFDNLNAIGETLPRTWELMKKFQKWTNPAGWVLREKLFSSGSNDIQAATKATNDMTKAVNGLADAEKRQKEIGDSFAKAMGKIKEEAERTRKVLDEIKTPIDRYGDAIKEAFDLLLRGRITQEQYDKYLEKSKKNFLPKEAKPDPIDLSSQTFAQVSGRDAAAYLNNVARGTQINGAMLRGPQDAARVQQVSDPKLDRTNDLLSTIADNTESQTAAYA